MITLRQKIPLKIQSSPLYLLFYATIFVLIAGFRPIGIDNDSNTYSVFIQSLPEISFTDKEPAFWFIHEISKFFFDLSERCLFLIFAILGVSLKVIAIHRLSLLPILSFYTYIFLFFILHEMTQIRTGVATGIFLLAIKDAYDRNLIKYLTKTALASLFHYSAIIMLIIYFLHPRKINNFLYIALPIIGIFLSVHNSFILKPMETLSFYLPSFIGIKIQSYIVLFESGIHSHINLANFFIMSLLCLYYIMLFNTNKFKSPYDILLLKILCFSLFFFYSFSSIPVFAFRISEFFAVVCVILLPHFMLIFKQKQLVMPWIVIWLSSYFFFIQLLRNINYKSIFL